MAGLVEHYLPAFIIKLGLLQPTGTSYEYETRDLLSSFGAGLVPEINGIKLLKGQVMLKSD